MELTNNTILVTGGTSGLGLELATQLLALGNTVLITGRDQARLDQTQKQLPKVHTFRSDVSDPAAIALLFQQTTQQFPDLNILINNAGEMRRLDLLDPAIDQDNANKEIAINLSGPVRMVQAFLPHLRTKKVAAIMNVSSGLAFIPFPISPIYGATKAGLRAYTQALRVQLKRTNIKVFELIAPAANTPLAAKFANEISSSMAMDADKLIQVAIKGMMKNKYEIYPGMSGFLRFMSRLAPSLMLSQMSKIADKALA